MAQSIPQAVSSSNTCIDGNSSNGSNKIAWIKEPLQPTGILNDKRYFEVTPIIGRTYPDLQIRDILNAANTPELLREMAIIVSTRGVVFFKNQDLTLSEQKEFTRLLGKYSGKPKTSSLHIHPSGNAGQDISVDAEAQADKEYFVVSNQLAKKMFQATPLDINAKKNRNASFGWHTDLMFENIPSDYACLKMHTLPPSGGDTLWASGVELYNRFSTPFQRFLQNLTITSASPIIRTAAEKGGFKLHLENRGAPENRGDDFTASHPVVRANPVTGLNSVYAVGLHVKGINGITGQENDLLLKYILNLIVQNHDLQVRHRWEKNDIAIWDNRSVYHAATADFDDIHPRAGVRVTSIGERPYFDPASEA